MFEVLLNLFSSAPTVTFCETPSGGLIARPWYLISNIPYILVGCYLLWKHRESRLARMFGITAIMIGSFSSLYDITYAYGAQFLDLAAMFFFVLLLITLNWHRIKNKKITYRTWAHPLGITVVVLGLLLFVYIKKGMFGNYTFSLLIGLLALSEFVAYRKRPAQYRNWLIATAIFLLASPIWMLDAFHIWCDPSNVLNGRGIFHYATSVVILFLYLFYRQFE